MGSYHDDKARDHDNDQTDARSWGPETDAYRFEPTPTDSRWFRRDCFRTERLLDLLERAHSRVAFLLALRDEAEGSAYLTARIDGMLAVARERVRRLGSAARQARRDERRHEAPAGPDPRRLGLMSPILAAMISRLSCVGHD